jgi:hypothetical protein
MNVRRLVLDVDWASSGPGVARLAHAIDEVDGVEALNITITEIDLKTIGSDIAAEGENIDLERLTAAITDAGAVVHSIDQIVVGDRMVDGGWAWPNRTGPCHSHLRGRTHDRRLFGLRRELLGGARQSAAR